MDKNGQKIIIVAVLALFFINLSSYQALEITRLEVPNFILNGSRDNVTLDCEYTYNIKDDKKLVVKWFHENDPNPVYQWIPELGTVHHEQKFRINASYVVPHADNYTKLRALNILKPTTELSGRYSCQIQSLEGADTAEDTMIVYALPDYVNLNYTTMDGIVVIYCEVESVYPIPLMSLFQTLPGEGDEIPIEDVYLDYDLQNGSYDVVLSTNFSENELATEGLRFFACSVVLNGTEYEKYIKVPYLPVAIAEKQEGDDSDTDVGSRHSSSITLTVLFILLMFFT